MNAIRNRLLLILILVIVLSGALTVWGSYRSSAHEVEELFDAQLAQSARVLLSIILTRTRHEDFRSIQEFLDAGGNIPAIVDDDAGSEEQKDYHEYERKLAFQLWDPNGRLLLHSGHIGTEPLSPQGLDPHQKGYHDETFSGENWRVFTLWDDQHGYLIQVGERYDIRDELVSEIVFHFLTPSVISIPIIAFLIWWSIGKALQPLQRLRTAVANRDPDNLEGLQFEGVPDEVVPLVSELNTLFRALNTALEKERRFTDDAAHELRTPLSALKTRVQVALRSDNDVEREEALRDILAGVDRMTHMLNQMLTLARLDNTRDIEPVTVDLQQMLEAVVRQLSAKAGKKSIAIEIESSPGLSLVTEPVSLEILLRNLIDNAVHYTPGGGQVSIVAEQQPAGVVVSITDSGPGIKPELYQRVFERYFRKPGQSQSGSGLGLAIARRCADLLQAELELGSASTGGLSVRVTLRDYQSRTKKEQ
ncbi:MAG: ATP-binding protein [Pseudomonadota bacterium]|nr:ATP-binding protein [Pseudomonadota bacterium]